MSGTEFGHIDGRKSFSVPDTFSLAGSRHLFAERHTSSTRCYWSSLALPEDVWEDRAKRLMLELERLASHDEPQPLGSYRPEGSNGSSSANNTEKREGLRRGHGPQPQAQSGLKAGRVYAPRQGPRPRSAGTALVALVMIGRPWPPACCDDHRREQGNQDRKPLERADRIGTEIHQTPPSARGSKLATARRPTTCPSMKRSTDSVSPRILGAGYGPPGPGPPVRGAQVHFECVAGDVHDPVHGDAAAAVGRGHGTIISQGGVGDLDDQGDVGRAGMVIEIIRTHCREPPSRRARARYPGSGSSRAVPTGCASRGTAPGRGHRGKGP